MARVLAFANKLRGHGVDAWIDQYEQFPEMGWPIWMEGKIREADFVLAVCTEGYCEKANRRVKKGKGVKWETLLVYQDVYDKASENRKVVPVILSKDNEAHIIDVLRPFTYYNVGDDDGYLKLYRYITNQPEIKAPPLGTPLVFPVAGTPSGLAEVQAVLDPHIREVQMGTSPSALLVAQNEVVGFVQEAREREIAFLEEWCKPTKSDQAGIVLFTGPGGAGKTRLFIEWCKRLRKRKWAAGFLRDDATEESIDIVARAEAKTFAVIDYADRRIGIEELLSRMLKLAKGRKQPLRIALVAREAGPWWKALGAGDSEDLRAALTGEPHLALTPITIEGKLREKLFLKSYEDLKKRTGRPAGDAKADLSDRRFERILYIAMAALARVEGYDETPSKLVKTTLGREQRLWVAAHEKRLGKRIAGKEDFLRRASRAVGAITLVGGVPMQEAGEFIAGVEGPAEGDFTETLYELYPSPAGRIGGLEPDLLGEALLADVMEEGHTRGDYLEKVLGGRDDRTIMHGLHFLGSDAFFRHDDTARHVTDFLCAGIERRAPIAYAAAKSLGEETAFSPLGAALAAALEHCGTTSIAAALERDLTESFIARTAAVYLREVSEWASRKLLASPPATHDEGTLKERARLLNNVATDLSDLGRREEALKAAQEATDIYRELSNANPGAFLPDLAMSLNNLGSSFSDLGRREEALKAAQEAVNIRRELSNANPGAFLPDLAMSLNNLGKMLSALGRREEALKAAQEAVNIRRELSNANPGAFLPDLAMSLHNLSISFGDFGHKEDALKPAQEAVGLYADLADKLPQVFARYLLGSTRNLLKRLEDTGQSPASDPTVLRAIEVLTKHGALPGGPQPQP